MVSTSRRLTSTEALIQARMYVDELAGAVGPRRAMIRTKIFAEAELCDLSSMQGDPVEVATLSEIARLACGWDGRAGSAGPAIEDLRRVLEIEPQTA